MLNIIRRRKNLNCKCNLSFIIKRPFYVTQPLPNFYVESVPVELMQFLFGLYHTYIDLEVQIRAFILNNIDLFSPEQLRNLHLLVAEIINLQERIYYLLQHWLDIMGEEYMQRNRFEEFIERDLMIDISQDLNNEAENLLRLLRILEGRLNLPRSEIIPINNTFE